MGKNLDWSYHQEKGVQCIRMNPLNPNSLFAATSDGIYKTVDAGESLQLDLNISPANRNLRVATHGNGAYQRPLIYEPLAYLVYTMSPIPNVVMVSTGIWFTASVTNFGTQAQTELSSVELRVLDETDTEHYSNTQKILGLNPKETKTVTFTGTFTPHQTGEYEVQFINLGSFSQPRNDTTRQVIRAITPPTIAYSTVTQKLQDYNEISGGHLFFFGDDDYQIVRLPLPFIYDSFEYDYIQICTNGWCEFGTGTPGTERAVSTPAQIGTIGANENGRMASTSRPTKALGPWWEDLNTEGGGVVSYKTIGSSPNRVFVIQWKNVRAYYSAATSTRLNFQVRLYETTNIIEYHYGPIERGTFIGGDLGAAIGFKDHIGGDYHFYDITVGGIVPVSQHRTDLNPLTDWPGPNSIFIIQTPSTNIDEDKPEISKQFALYQNYPNPFNPTTTIRYDLPKASYVSLKIYNSIGQEVRKLINQVQPSGSKSIVWDGMDNIGRTVVSGLYFYRLKVGEKILTRKMVIVK